jgi:hypothetical protein
MLLNPYTMNFAGRQVSSRRHRVNGLLGHAIQTLCISRYGVEHHDIIEGGTLILVCSITARIRIH